MDWDFFFFQKNWTVQREKQIYINEVLMPEVFLLGRFASVGTIYNRVQSQQ